MIVREKVLGPEASFESDDLFSRKGLATGLTNLVSANGSPMVLLLDGQWGTGKTYFLRLWENQLRKSGRAVIYLNSFEKDYQGDAFFSVASQILKAFDDLEIKNPQARTQFRERAARVAKVLSVSALKIGLHVATAGLVNAKDGGQLLDAAAEGFDTEASKLLERAIDEGAKEEQTLQSFKDALAVLSRLFAEASGGGEAKPLIFIVDELDRCRPTFSLQILEVIKHFFNVEGVHFVLGAHSAALAASIQKTYGDGIDGLRYLSRFFHFSVRFDDGDLRTAKNNLLRYCDYLWRESGISEDHNEIREGSIDLLSGLSVTQNLSFRDIQRVISIISLSLRYMGKRHLRTPPILVGLAILRVFEPGLYAKAKRGSLTYGDVEKWFGFKEEYESGETFLQWMDRWFHACLIPDAELTSFDRETLGVLFQYSVDRNLPMYFANDILDRIWLVPDE